MKAIYRIFIAIFAAAALAVSCSKDAVPGDGAQSVTGGPRVITLSFGGYTKSSLDGFTPKFSAGDRVMLSNGTRAEECTVNVDAKGKATVTTNLTGILNAVSPASAAVTGGGELTYKIPVTQSGRFSDVAIATAQDIISSAVFEIQVSLLKFYVDQSISVRSITITGTQNIATSGNNLKQITVGTGTGFLHETTDDPQQRLCYAAVLPGIPASSLKFTSDTDTQGTVIRQSPASTVTLAANTLYKAFIPYYIKIHIGPGENDYQRWGYCNIGAFLPEEYGRYFAWGDVEGQTLNSSVWSGGGFSWALCPHTNATFNETTNKNVFTKYIPAGKTEYWGLTGAPDNKLVLELEDDAANVNWGTDWHMPTGGTDATADFNVLINTCQTISASSQGVYPYSSTVSSGDVPSAKGIYRYAVTGEVAGVYFIDGEGNKLFFPLAGLVENTTYYYVGSNANYWSNTLRHDVPQAAYYLQLPSGSVRPLSDVGRLRGGSIRPIYKTPADPLDIGEYDEPENIE